MFVRSSPKIFYPQKVPIIKLIIMVKYPQKKHMMLKTNRTLSSLLSLKNKIVMLSMHLMASLYKSACNWQVLQEPLKLRVWFSNPNETTPLKYMDEVFCGKIICKEKWVRTIPSIYLQHSGVIIACCNLPEQLDSKGEMFFSIVIRATSHLTRVRQNTKLFL